MQLKDAIKKRKSVKKFFSGKVNWRDILKAIDAARYAPCAGNQFCCRFILVKDKEKIKKLSEACQQDFVADADYVVVVASDDSRLKVSFSERGEKYARQQAGAAIENFLLALTELGLVTCWTGHFDDNGIKQILSMPDEIVVEALFPIGKETKIKTTEKIKTELEDIIYFDKWKNKYMEPKSRVSMEGI